MPWLETIEEYEVIIPTRRRRLVLLVIVCLLGGLVAYAFLPVVGWSNAALAVLVIALLAGISALWSP